MPLAGLLVGCSRFRSLHRCVGVRRASEDPLRRRLKELWRQIDRELGKDEIRPPCIHRYVETDKDTLVHSAGRRLSSRSSAASWMCVTVLGDAHRGRCCAHAPVFLLGERVRHGRRPQSHAPHVTPAAALVAIDGRPPACSSGASRAVGRSSSASRATSASRSARL